MTHDGLRIGQGKGFWHPGPPPLLRLLVSLFLLYEWPVWSGSGTLSGTLLGTAPCYGASRDWRPSAGWVVWLVTTLCH